MNDPTNSSTNDFSNEADNEMQERRLAKKKSKSERLAVIKNYEQQMQDYTSGSEAMEAGSVSEGLVNDFTGVQLSGRSDSSRNATPLNTPPIVPKPLADLRQEPEFQYFPFTLSPLTSAESGF